MTHPTHGLDPNALEAAPLGYVTETAAEAMRAAKPGWHYHVFVKDQSDPKATVALYTHPASPPVGGAVKVKPLEWHPISNGDWSADGALGKYQCLVSGKKYIVLLDGIKAAVQLVAKDLRTHVEAKAAAQADYETRILSALASSERSEREAEYVPTIIRNDSAGFYEFVTEDVPALYSGIMAANVERIGTLKGDLIGFRIYDPLEPRASDRARTIEECAKVADGVRQRLEAGRNGKPLSQIDEHTAGTGDRIAAAIRKLSEVSHEH